MSLMREFSAHFFVQCTHLKRKVSCCLLPAASDYYRRAPSNEGVHSKNRVYEGLNVRQCIIFNKQHKINYFYQKHLAIERLNKCSIHFILKKKVLLYRIPRVLIFHITELELQLQSKINKLAILCLQCTLSCIYLGSVLFYSSNSS